MSTIKPTYVGLREVRVRLHKGGAFQCSIHPRIHDNLSIDLPFLQQ